jgi:pantothenate kinase
VRALSPSPTRRVIVGLCGAPGSGKSTLAEGLVASLVDLGAVVIPLDGFHLAASAVERAGRSASRGAIDTFDAPGFRHLLERVRGDTVEQVWAPRYDRTIEDPIAGAIRVGPENRVVLVEGNYLLSADPAWIGQRMAYDEVWYLAADEERRRLRLTARHISVGKSPADARRWVDGSDEENAREIAATAGRADVVVDAASWADTSHLDRTYAIGIRDR